MRRCARGFTLIEILVAMAVLAVGMLAALSAVAQLTAGHSYLRERTLATWVAHNVLLEEQLKSAWPGIGDRKGEAEMAELDWVWRINVVQTPEDDMRRLDLEVWLGEETEQPLARLSGFVARP